MSNQLIYLPNIYVLRRLLSCYDYKDEDFIIKTINNTIKFYIDCIKTSMFLKFEVSHIVEDYCKCISKQYIEIYDEDKLIL